MNNLDKKKAAEIFKLSRSLTTTLQILVSDVQYAESSLQNDQSHEQFWRRVIIRAVCALGEGTLYSCKGMIPKIADFFDVALTEKEEAILNERKKLQDGSSRPFFLPVRDNLKETFRLFSKVHGVQVAILFDQGYEDFCGTFDLRNGLMHPKKHTELEIKDDTYRASIRGWNWFNSEALCLLAECNKKLPFSEK
jgi:hypothetical protein